jgi:prolyl oligopeptidase
MKRHPLRAIATLTLVAFLPLTACKTEAPPAEPAVAYPATTTVDHVDTYHGVEVPDPYRWLEDDVRENADVKAWVDAQNEVTFAYLEGIPERAAIAERLEQLWDYEKFTTPYKEGGRYFYRHNDGLQNQYVLYTQESLDAEREMLLDPNSWSEDGTVALSSYFPSPDGRYLAYLVQDGGSDWRTARVLDIESRELLDDELSWLKFTGLAWAPDGSGFYYSRYPEPEEGAEFQSLNKEQTVYFHEIGTPQADDPVVYGRPDEPEWGHVSEVTEDGAYLIITVWKGTDNRYQILVQDLNRPGSKPEFLIEGFDFDYSLAGNSGSTLYFRTDNEAPKGKLIGIDVRRPAPERWQTVVPEGEHVLQAATLIGDHFVLGYLQDARSLVQVVNLDGEAVRTVDLPGIGTASGFSGKADDTETFFSFSSYATPPSIYRYDVATGKVEPFKEVAVDFNPADYVVKQVFYTSKDGTRVPMFISHRAGLEPDGELPTLLYGYGGFNISQRPRFSIPWLAWMELGGVFAVANIRGGGEYGEEWHEAGTKLQKQNVFDDFIAAGEYLVSEGYTQPDRLAIFGGSNGGLLVGAVTNQRPDLFGAAIPAVGVMDMLRFHNFTAGRFWVDDYGSADDPEEFEALRAYSPYHNIRPGTRYPAVMATTADTDDRVVPGHSFKYMAALQAAQVGDAPVLIRIETRAGHGSGKPTSKQIEEYADRWAFLVENLHMEVGITDAKSGS